MRYLVLVFMVLLASFAPSVGQEALKTKKGEKISDDERAFLRKGFNLPDSAPVTEIKAKTLALNAAVPLKISLESILDSKVRESVANWITEWNQKEADEYGKIEITPDSLQADVTVVRYLRELPQTADPALIAMATYKDSEGKVQRLKPTYTYLLVRKPDSLSILWRKVYLTFPEGYEVSARLLANELKKLMKERAKVGKS